MTSLEQWLALNGLALPSRLDALEIAIAGTLMVFALALGVLAERKIGAQASQWWKSHVAHHGEGLWERMPAILRHGAAALGAAIVMAAYQWSAWGGLPIGLALGSAAALASHQILRGLGIPRWASWLVSAILCVALFSRAVGGLDAITTTLDGVGVDLGRRRLSLLAITSALLAIVIIVAVVRLANRIVGHTIAQTKTLDATQKLLGQKLATIAIVIAAFLFSIDLLGIDLTAFAVFSGAFGLAVGFGLQKTVGNLIAGIILLMDRSIKPGDVIVVGDSFGWVNKIGVRAVSVITRDGKEHLIPNENLMTQEVENWSFSDRNVRVRIPVSVSYDCDLKQAQDLMLAAAKESPRVLSSPAPNVWLTNFGNDGVEHEILAWISDPESGVGNVKSDVLNRLWRKFKDAGVSIPFAQRDIYVKSWPSPPPVASPSTPAGEKRNDSAAA
ncbi:mechanosensitive ion channel family protein [Sphingomonas mucosissima]|uniref:Putative MscS family protein.1 n=1 Tax=Sphingomonas mucosissima TaxID=370959 RepID=A0A245ZLD6_9SPHN|nr:mechanosensitive ion channel domain-containing protein [Sphingomonas mucosissima]OWK30559.1 putative MscS family protein.1 precursor [Sphingomonas mucosissima]